MIKQRLPERPRGNKGVRVKSYAKLNLYLEVLNKRRDNYHNIRTVFERINLCDEIIVKPRRDNKIRIICSNPGVPTDCSNLAWRSAKLLQDNFSVKRGADIRIIKRIPVGAGLGGGSSNAAAVLKALDKLWKLNAGRKKLLALAGKVGSDVPFFLYDTAFALAGSRGDRITALRQLSRLNLWHILVVPRHKVSTPLVYKKWDESSRLTRPKYNVKILTSGLKQNRPFLNTGALFNSLEQVTARLYPCVNRIKDKLKDLGVKLILMSGSGPAVFGIVASRKEAAGLYRYLKGNKFGEVFAARTI